MKKITLGILIAVIMVLGTASAVFADGPTTVNINWNGGGEIETSVTTGGDSTHSFYTGGAGGIMGSFTCTDNNDNPYGYQVDSVSSYIQSWVSNAETEYIVTRDDSKTSMYGPAGQMSYSYIGASNGWAEMATGSSCNYAAQKDCTYSKPKTTNGKNFEANATEFSLYKWVGNGSIDNGAIIADGNWASFSSVGTGIAQIDCMSCETGGKGTTKLGRGCGCYTNADAFFSGAGEFSVNAQGTNGITSPGMGWTVPGNGTFSSCSWKVVATYSGDMTVDDYSIEVN